MPEEHFFQLKSRNPQNKVMEVTLKLQPRQEPSYLLFEETEGQGTLLEQVVVTVKKQLEGPISDAVV
jgi:hypothetical protein